MTATLQGIGVSNGIGIGPVARMGSPITALPAPNPADDPAEELARAHRALDAVAERLGELQDRAEGTAAQVLAAQVLMARDPALRDAVKEHTDRGLPAPHAVDAAFAGFRAMLEGAGAYMAERVADLDDIRNRTIARLLHLPMPGIPRRDTPFVLVADDLAPADTVDLDPTLVVALVTQGGGPTSHTAIIAKAMGLPAIVMCEGILDVEDGTEVIVDGTDGEVTVDPSSEVATHARERIERRAALLEQSSGPGRTKDGHHVRLFVNFGGATDIAAVSMEAEGIGLLRTEFLFLDRATEPTVDEQTKIYEDVFAAFADKKVIVRTLDVGADKPLPFVDPGPGENPALGLRGSRLGERNIGLIDRQLEAIARAAAAERADVHVMAPMIATVEEAEAFAAMVHGVGLPSAGVMVEVPSAAIGAAGILEVVDFVSLGTNDLSQYTLAADRMVGELGALLDPWQPAVLQLIRMTVEAAVAAGKPAGVCGEAASDPLLALVFTGLGVTSLSMSPPSIPEVRAALADRTRDECVAAAKAALAAPTATAARDAVRSLFAD